MPQDAAHKTPEPVIIKKYANRRLYNTQTSTYVTLEDLYEMIKRNEEFVVRDAKTEEDLTRSVLVQIIFDREAKEPNLLPMNFLKQIIGFYDSQMHSFVPHYLEATMQSFTQNQDKMREYLSDSMRGYFSFGQLEELGKQNMELFQKAFSMFAPFDPTKQGGKK